MTKAHIDSISPCFIVSDVPRSIAFYRDRLGFEVMYQDPDTDPFFAIVQRDNIMLFLKSDREAHPQPNHLNHHYMHWDAYLSVPDPEALAAEFNASGATFLKPLGITTENLLGFEISDPDNYILFFGRPNTAQN